MKRPSVAGSAASGPAANGMAPEVAVLSAADLESPNGAKASASKTVSMAGMPNIQPFQGYSNDDSKYKKSKGKPFAFDADALKKMATVAGAIWLGGILFGYDVAWPLQMLLNALQAVISVPPFSWLFGWVSTPLSWIFNWFYRGAPLVEQGAVLQELRLPGDQVSVYLDHYVQQYGDAALIFATHDGYPQLVNGLLSSPELGYQELVDATDESGNTALIYSAAKGYRQCTAGLLRNGADPNVANQGNGGRSPLMEAAGAGFKDIVAAIRLSSASVDAVDDFGNTALHYAAYHGHLSVVQELLKSSPRRDVKNSHGQTAASYATKHRFKGIADMLNRPPTRREKAAATAQEATTPERGRGPQKAKEEAAAAATAEAEGEAEDPPEGAAAPAKKAKEEKRVKGRAEELPKKEKEDFAPKVSGISELERKALEDDIAKLKRQHEEAELRSQKRVVELLERSSNQQKDLDSAQRQARTMELNMTDFQLKVQELESRHQSSELRVMEEKQRADRLHEDVQRVQLEAERHKSRADLHAEDLRKKHEEVSKHLSTIEQHSKEVSQLREQVLQHQDRVALLESELTSRGGSIPASPERKPPPPPPPPQQEAAASASAAAATAEGGAEKQQEQPPAAAEEASAAASTGSEEPAPAPPAPPGGQAAEGAPEEAAAEAAAEDHGAADTGGEAAAHADAPGEAPASAADEEMAPGSSA